MPTFKYIAKNRESRTVTGKISTDNKANVIEELRKRKLTIISVVEVKDAAAKKSSFQSKKVKGDEIVIFARQLATMVDAGIPIIQGLDALGEQVTHPVFKKVLGTVQEDIEHGTSLSAAFSKHPQVFDTLFINMVKVGETGGALSVVLDRVATYMEKTLKLKRKVKSALIYPIVVISMAIIITVVLLVKVVPTFTEIYASFDSDLPAMTQVLVNISNALKYQLPYYIAGLAALLLPANPELNPDSIISIFQKSSDQFAQPYNTHGYGIPDLQPYFSSQKEGVTRSCLVYPNPTSTDQVKMVLKDPVAHRVTRGALYNIRGQWIAPLAIQTISDTTIELTLPLNQVLANQLLILMVEADQQTFSGKLVYIKP